MSRAFVVQQVFSVPASGRQCIGIPWLAGGSASVSYRMRRVVCGKSV